MTTKAADDLEAIRAGMKRIEEEKQRMLNGDSEPQAVAVEDYQMDVAAKTPTIKVQPAPGAFRASQHGYGYEYWNGRDWVSREYWEDYGDQS